MQRKPPDRSASPLDLIDTEIIAEQASALGRLGRALEAALQTLGDFDAAHAVPPSEGRRAVLVAEAGYALWLFVVQREACGLRDSRTVMRDYAVPGEVQVRMGLPPPQPQGKRRHSSPSPTSGKAGVGAAGAALAKGKTPP